MFNWVPFPCLLLARLCARSIVGGGYAYKINDPSKDNKYIYKDNKQLEKITLSKIILNLKDKLLKYKLILQEKDINLKNNLKFKWKWVFIWNYIK